MNYEHIAIFAAGLILGTLMAFAYIGISRSFAYEAGYQDGYDDAELEMDRKV